VQGKGKSLASGTAHGGIHTGLVEGFGGDKMLLIRSELAWSDFGSSRICGFPGGDDVYGVMFRAIAKGSAACLAVASYSEAD
jgi:hypothetical protein